MLSDIVIDTNVLVHASNEQILYCPESIAFLQALLKTQTLLCVDEGFSIISQFNRSFIGQEYLKHLQNGMLGFAVVAELASSKRVKIVTDSVKPAVAKRLNQLVRKKTDRRFIKITINCDEKTLSSHDFEDFPAEIRTRIRGEMGVSIRTARETQPLL